VSIEDDRFTPQEVEIDAGETVVWTNDGDRAHTVTSEDGTFDSGFIGANKVFEHTFTEPGTYYYFCEYHGGPRSGMWGVVIVNAPPEEVSMTNSAFVPEEVHVPAGTTVKWMNSSQVAHTVTSTTGLFDSGNISKDASYSFTFTEPGEYLYFCNYHGAPNGTGMSAVVIVDPPPSETGLLLGLPASLVTLVGAQLRLRRRRSRRAESSDPEEAPVD
jgi:plastocyanin